MSMRRNSVVHSDERVTLYRGEAEYGHRPDGEVFVLTNPYGPVPSWIAHVPGMVHQWVHRKPDLAQWLPHGLELWLTGLWNDRREAFWSFNRVLPAWVEISEFKPEPGGWYPEAMVDHILATVLPVSADIAATITIWDGFAGRGTVGKVALARGFKYVGIERHEPHIEMAKEFLGLSGAATNG